MSTLAQRENKSANYRNPLLSAAAPLLNALCHLRQAPAPADAGELRQRLIEQVRRFDETCQGLALDYKCIIGARYCLCTSLDEAVSLTDWGSDGVWSGQGLLATFHNETHGGEKFFQLMATLSRQPEKHIDLLELIYFCLLLGFGGRYRVMENGVYRLEIVIQRLALLIRGIRGDYAPPLSQIPPAPPPPAPARRIRATVAPCLLLGATALCALYIALDARLDSSINRVQKSIYSLPLPKAPVPAPGFSLRELMQSLEPEIAAKRVTVKVLNGDVTISLQGGDVFASGSAILNPRYQPIVQLIARQAMRVPGVIRVRGHSDNQKISTPAFPSNHALSLARAGAVAQELGRALSQPQRVKPESAAHRPPLVPNTSARNRAINRRIDIVFRLTPADERASRWEKGQDA